MLHLRLYFYNKKKQQQKTDTCKENIYTDITNTILTQTQALTNNKNVIERADKIQPSLKDLNSAFSTVHCAISHTEPIEPRPSSVTKIVAEKHVNQYTEKCSHSKPFQSSTYNRNTAVHTKKQTGCAGSDGGKGNREQSPNDFINRKRKGATE